MFLCERVSLTNLDKCYYSPLIHILYYNIVTLWRKKLNKFVCVPYFMLFTDCVEPTLKLCPETTFPTPLSPSVRKFGFNPINYIIRVCTRVISGNLRRSNLSDFWKAVRNRCLSHSQSFYCSHTRPRIIKRLSWNYIWYIIDNGVHVSGRTDFPHDRIGTFSSIFFYKFIIIYRGVYWFFLIYIDEDSQSSIIVS